MRVLGVDFGSKRIGLAVGVDDPFVATSPHPTLEPSGTLSRDAARIVALAGELEVDAVVVGIPFNEQDGRMAGICQRLASAIRELGIEVGEVDESSTSVEAEANLIHLGAKAALRKRMRDGEAARLIVERYFEQRSG